ncbi:MAG: phosphotransferase [Legionellales bacterium]|nr:phosphotransferase [Legionellales bacterium]
MVSVDSVAVLEQRQADLTAWLSQQLDINDLAILADDCSFRRYFRVKTPKGTFVAMDAPPDKEDCRPFVTVAQVFSHYGIKVPRIYAQNLEEGFLLLDDFGDRVLLSQLNSQTAESLYRLAIDELLQIQTIEQQQPYLFPLYNGEYLRKEINFFQEWCLEKHLFLTLTPAEQRMIDTTFDALIKNAVSQPQVCVHRDYHSRNLLVLNSQGIGVIDFQDAMWGPVTYDLVSLLKDCYITWPQSLVDNLVNYYYQHAYDRHLIAVDKATFVRWFDLMGVQRHLKAIYRFALKFRRDGASAYLADIPRALNYVLDVAARYAELTEFNEYLQSVVLPTLNRN